MKTTSFEISKKLAEIGFEASSHFREFISDEEGNFLEEVNSFDLETILEALPKDGLSLIRTEELGDSVVCGNDICVDRLAGESWADCAAKTLILLHEKGIINFNKSDEVKNV